MTKATATAIAWSARVSLQFAALIICVASVPASFGQDAWTITWASAPVPGKPNSDLAGKTLRQIVQASVSGSRMRVRISNVFGDRSLRIEDVHAALPGGRGFIVASTDHALSFHGRSFVVIPPGATALSDAASFPVPSLADVAISFFVPGDPGAITWHPSAHRTSYIARGDVSGKPMLDQPEPMGSYYFLSGLVIQGKGVQGVVATLGASITEGYKATDNSHREWPAVLARRLASRSVAVANVGISGNRLLHAGAGPSAPERFDRDVLEQPGIRWVIFSDDPINDLGSTRPPPALDELVDGMKQLIAAAHARGIRFYCSTLTPFEGANYWTPAEEAVREGFNEFVRSRSSGCDGVVDQDRATHDPAHPTRFLPAFDSGDHLHPNDAGHCAIGKAADLSLFQ